jgi:hypothetical protein
MKGMFRKSVPTSQKTLRHRREDQPIHAEPLNVNAAGTCSDRWAVNF